MRFNKSPFRTIAIFGLCGFLFLTTTRTSLGDPVPAGVVSPAPATFASPAANSDTDHAVSASPDAGLPPAGGLAPANAGATPVASGSPAAPIALPAALAPNTESASSPATSLPGADRDGLRIGDPAPMDDPFWRVLEKRLLTTLGSITPDVSTLHVNMEVTAGPVFLGSGTLAVKKPGFAHFELFSRQASCRYQNLLGTSSCFLAHPGRMIAFKAGGDSQVPVPLLKIEREETQGFRFDFNMLISPGTASQPIQFGVHPDAGPYLAKRIREKFPRVLLASSTASFFAPGNSTPSVILEWGGETISSGTAWFDREGNKPPIRLIISGLRVNAPLADPSPAEILGESYQPSGSIDTVYTFVDGFYKLMSDLMPRDNE